MILISAGKSGRIVGLRKTSCAPLSGTPRIVLAGLLKGVRKFPTRAKCATLAWHALEQALNTPPDDHAEKHIEV